MALLDAFARAVRKVLGIEHDHRIPSYDLTVFYRAEVKARAADGSTVDVTPANPLIKPHQGVPLLVPPGEVVVLAPGAVVLLGWEGGDPERPRAVPIFEGGATVQKRVANAQELHLGGEDSDAVVTKKDLQALYFAINAAGTTAQDGGAAFKAALLAGLGTAGWTTGATDGQLGSAVVKAKRT